MKHSNIIVGAAVLTVCGFAGSVITGVKAIGISFPVSQSQAQVPNYSMDDDSLCELARKLADWVCGTSLNYGIDQLTDGFVDQVDWDTWDSLKPLILRCMNEIDVILDPNLRPSLNPSHAGSGALVPNTSSMTTEEMGDDLCDRARKAAEEICNSSDPDQEYAGTQLRQMRWILADLYELAKP